MNRQRNQHGFTLIELVITVGLMGVVLALGVPTMRTFLDQQKLQSSIATIESNLRRARSVAITKNSNVRMWVFDDTRSYTVARDNEGDGNFSNVISTGNLDPTISVADLEFGGGNFLSFDSRGRPDNAGRVRLESRRGQLREVRVSPGSGNVSVVTPDN